ncbi:hypothetical protein M3197_09120 [Sporosarcina aquimarina]|uniref:hypothetical protein n=1 Tax=Sporosarcina aquimarina TaxID=114975 RepID=UPI00203D441B|nr:hypothetical protein [Sporosarcina aquimarina]MCM3757650.1 hypothetical protein [Sporosarcina aquimarina]
MDGNEPNHFDTIKERGELRGEKECIRNGMETTKVNLNISISANLELYEAENIEWKWTIGTKIPLQRILAKHYEVTDVL